jgi:hypothetical protein
LTVNIDFVWLGTKRMERLAKNSSFIYLTFDTDGQLSTRLYDKGDDINSANMYSPIVSYDGFVYHLIFIS